MSVFDSSALLPEGFSLPALTAEAATPHYRKPVKRYTKRYPARRVTYRKTTTQKTTIQRTPVVAHKKSPTSSQSASQATNMTAATTSSASSISNMTTSLAPTNPLAPQATSGNSLQAAMMLDMLIQEVAKNIEMQVGELAAMDDVLTEVTQQAANTAVSSSETAFTNPASEQAVATATDNQTDSQPESLTQQQAATESLAMVPVVSPAALQEETLRMNAAASEPTSEPASESASETKDKDVDLLEEAIAVPAILAPDEVSEGLHHTQLMPSPLHKITVPLTFPITISETATDVLISSSQPNLSAPITNPLNPSLIIPGHSPAIAPATGAPEVNPSLTSPRNPVTALQTPVEGSGLANPVLKPQPIATPSSLKHLGRRIVINLPARRLKVYDGDTVIKTFAVGVGRQGFMSPVGSHKVIRKLKDPAWENPYQSKGAMVIKPGDGNPLGTRWIGFKQDSKGEFGIHGTNRPESVGHFVSHGCIRMLVPEAEQVFDMVEVGTPVEVTYDVLEIRQEGDKIQLSIHPDPFAKGGPRTVQRVEQLIQTKYPDARINAAQIQQKLRFPNEQWLTVATLEVPAAPANTAATPVSNPVSKPVSAEPPSITPTTQPTLIQAQ